MKKNTQKQALIEAASLLAAAQSLVHAAYIIAPTASSVEDDICDLLTAVATVERQILDDVDSGDYDDAIDNNYYGHARDAQAWIVQAKSLLGAIV